MGFLSFNEEESLLQNVCISDTTKWVLMQISLHYHLSLLCIL